MLMKTFMITYSIVVREIVRHAIFLITYLAVVVLTKIFREIHTTPIIRGGIKKCVH